MYGCGLNHRVAFGFPQKFLLGRWIKHGGFWPDPKLRLFRRGAGDSKTASFTKTLQFNGRRRRIRHGALLHHSYPTLADYIDHMNRYSSLGAEMAVAKGRRGFSLFNIVLRPAATFIYNYFFRLGFLDGREGLLLHLYHAVYVSWKYAKAWELARQRNGPKLESHSRMASGYDAGHGNSGRSSSCLPQRNAHDVVLHFAPAAPETSTRHKPSHRPPKESRRGRSTREHRRAELCAE